MEFNIKLSSFEGPFDLLLHLVEKAQVDISEISIGQITEEFLEAIENIEELDLETTSEFLLVAATLIDIKSRTLLPVRKGNGEEMDNLEDPRQQLIRRLLEYKKYKEVSQVMMDMANNAEYFHTRAPELIEPQKRPVNISLNQLFTAFQKALDREKLEKKIMTHNIQKEEITIGEQMELVLNNLREKGKLTFSQFLINAPSRYHIVISFLAILELIRLKAITVAQDEIFAEIYIFLREDVC